jgi:hypothetical protein
VAMPVVEQANPLEYIEMNYEMAVGEEVLSFIGFISLLYVNISCCMKFMLINI